MPRTLPWLRTADKPEKHNAPITLKPRKRLSSPADVVSSDLYDLDVVSGLVAHRGRSKQHVDRSPSTSPPPAAPSVERMREGMDADDAYMMVEDEFDATARLFTQHIHHAEYVRLRKLHRSRGAETLARVGHGTDGNTQQSQAVKEHIEAKDNTRKRKSEGLEESDESDDEYLVDPHLASLMTESQEHMSNKAPISLIMAKSSTRAAAGYAQSPRKATKIKDVFTDEQQQSQMPRLTLQGDGTDDDDLDAGASTRSGPSTAYKHINIGLDRPRPSTKMSSRSYVPDADSLKRLAKTPTEQADSSPGKDDNETRGKRSKSAVDNSKNMSVVRLERNSNVAEVLARRKGRIHHPEARPCDAPLPEVRVMKKSRLPNKSHPTTVVPKTNSMLETSRASEVLARRKTTPAKVNEGDEQRIKPELDDIPTFLF